MSVVVPAQLVPIDSTCTVSYPSSVCALSSQTFTITSFDRFANKMIFSFKANAQYFDETNPFTIRLTYGGSSIGSNTLLTVLRYCTNPCKQCTSNITQCLSCLPSPQATNTTYFPDNSTCVATCPSTYYLDGSQCSNCNATACL